MKVVEENSSIAIHQFKSTKEQSETDKALYCECWNCGYKHEPKKEACPAIGKMCNKCNKNNHFAGKCRSKHSVKAVADQDEVYRTGSSNLDDTQLVTLKLDSGNYLRFQVDTGAQCNVIPFGLYKNATRDYRLKKITPVNQQITAYSGTTIPVCRTTLLRVWRGDKRCKLNCKLVDQDDIRACLGMKIV